jgi:hypothetical protein
MALEDMWEALQLLKQENNNMCQVLEQLQIGILPIPQNSKSALN